MEYSKGPQVNLAAVERTLYNDTASFGLHQGNLMFSFKNVQSQSVFIWCFSYRKSISKCLTEIYKQQQKKRNSKIRSREEN